jgi:protein-S-isoprenylcysteine O-methyltransferase Ste14
MPTNDRATPPSSPGFRIWPPVSIAVPWLVGWALGRAIGLRFDPGWLALAVGWTLVLAFVAWNGWCLILFARHRTGLLPGQETSSLLRSGPFRVCRNPLYLGLLALYVGAALLAGSIGALVLTPVAWAGLHWGAVLPEERYLTQRLGEPYLAYCREVRRW